MADQLSGGAKCVKYTLFLFNMLFLLAGLALIIIGSIVLVHSKENTFSSSAGPAGIFIIVVGGVVFLVSFFGCAGAINNNYCMVVTYGVLLLLLLIAEIAGVITGFVLKDKVKDTILEKMKESMELYQDEKPEVTDTQLWNETQREFKCCGTTGYRSWNASKDMNSTRSVPDSCCKEVTKDCGQNLLFVDEKTAEKTLWTEGCYTAVSDHLKTYLIALGAVAASVALIELIGIVCAFCLASHLRKDYRVV